MVGFKWWKKIKQRPIWEWQWVWSSSVTLMPMWAAYWMITSHQKQFVLSFESRARCSRSAPIHTISLHTPPNSHLCVYSELNHDSNRRSRRARERNNHKRSGWWITDRHCNFFSKIDRLNLKYICRLLYRTKCKLFTYLSLSDQIDFLHHILKKISCIGCLIVCDFISAWD